MDFIGDLGGVSDLIIMIFGFFLYPYSNFSFTLELQKHLYKGRTNDLHMFRKESQIRGKDKLDQNLSTKLQFEISKHYTLHLKIMDKVKLYLSQYFGFLCCKPCWMRRDKFTKMYEEGASKMEKELNIFKLLKSIRRMKILVKNQMMTPKIKTLLDHSNKNIIYISTDSDSSGFIDSGNPETEEDRVFNSLAKVVFNKKKLIKT